MGARHRPRRHRDAERDRASARERRQNALRRRPRCVRPAHRSVRHRDRRNDSRAVARHRLVGRLVAHRVHAVAGVVARRPRSVRPAVRTRTDLSRPSRNPLVPALPHVVERRGGRVPGRDGRVVPHRVSARGTIRPEPDHRHHAAGDDARRRGGRRESRRPALSRRRRQIGAAANCRPGDPRDRRCVRRSRVRHWRGEDHAGARRERLRGRYAAQAEHARGDRRAWRRARSGRRGRSRAGGAVGARPIRGARAHRRDAARERRAAESGDALARRAPLLSVRHGGRAAIV